MLYLISRRYDERNHGRAISSGFLQALDQFLDLPDLDILVSMLSCVTHGCLLSMFRCWVVTKLVWKYQSLRSLMLWWGLHYLIMINIIFGNKIFKGRRKENWKGIWKKRIESQQKLQVLVKKAESHVFIRIFFRFFLFLLLLFLHLSWSSIRSSWGRSRTSCTRSRRNSS